MPIWLAPLFMLPFFAFPQHRLLVTVPVILIVFAIANDGWMSLPSSPDTVTVAAYYVIFTASLVIPGMEKGWLDSSRTARTIMAGCFLFGISLYYVLFPFIFRLGTYPLAGMTFLLLTVLPLVAGWVRKNELK